MCAVYSIPEWHRRTVRSDVKRARNTYLMQLNFLFLACGSTAMQTKDSFSLFHLKVWWKACNCFAAAPYFLNNEIVFIINYYYSHSGRFSFHSYHIVKTRINWRITLSLIICIICFPKFKALPRHSISFQSESIFVHRSISINFG